MFVAIQFCISPATTLEATKAYCSCGRRRVRVTQRRSSDPLPSRHRRHAFPTPRSPIIATSCFLSSPRVSSVGSLPRPSTLYVTLIVHQTPLPYPCLGTNNASERDCGALSSIVCQTAGHPQPLGAQDSTSSSLTLLREPTMTTMPSTRKRTRAASQAGAFACVRLCFVVALFWYRSRREREDWMIFFSHYM